MLYWALLVIETNFLYNCNHKCYHTLISSVAGIALGVQSYEDFMVKGTPFATSHAWQLGRGVIRALRMNKNPVEEILRLEEGSVLIIAGEVCPNFYLGMLRVKVYRKIYRNAHQQNECFASECAFVLGTGELYCVA